MNLVDMLMNKPIPKSLYADTPREKYQMTRAQKEAWDRNTKLANVAKMDTNECSTEPSRYQVLQYWNEAAQGWLDVPTFDASTGKTA